MFKGKGLVAFVDMLGFTAKVEQTWHTASPALDLILAFKEKVRTTKYGVIQWEGHPARIPEVRSLSDSLVFTYGIQDLSDPREFLSALSTMMMQIGSIRAMAADAGFAVRGGIEFGDIYIDEDDVIGPAFNAAYELESRIASTARVILGAAATERMVDEALLAPVGAYGGQIRNMFYRSSDGIMSSGVNLSNDLLNNLRALHDAAPEAVRFKYTEVIQAIDHSWEAPSDPGPWRAAAQIVRDKIRLGRAPKRAAPPVVEPPKAGKRQRNRQRGRSR